MTRPIEPVDAPWDFAFPFEGPIPNDLGITRVGMVIKAVPHTAFLWATLIPRRLTQSANAPFWIARGYYKSEEIQRLHSTMQMKLFRLKEAQNGSVLPLR